MRVQATHSTGYGAAAAATRRAGGSGFSLSDAGSAQAPARATAPRATAGIDALLALQAVDDTGERRRRTVKRGRTALDALEELKLGLIAGTLDVAALNRLKALVGSLAEPSGEPGLDGVMAEISLRAEVELAKFARTGR